MPETSERRRHLRGQVANHTRWGRLEEAARARTALAVEKAQEQIEALNGLIPVPEFGQVDMLVGAAEQVRAWALAQAEQAPPMPADAAQAISTALRMGKRGDAA